MLQEIQNIFEGGEMSFAILFTDYKGGENYENNHILH